MKILFVIDTLYSTNNGTSISALRYADELRRRGHIVRALASKVPYWPVYGIKMLARLR